MEFDSEILNVFLAKKKKKGDMGFLSKAFFLRGGRGEGEEGFGGHPFELFNTPRVVLTWIVARKVGRCDVGDGFGVDANNLDSSYQILILVVG